VDAQPFGVVEITLHLARTSVTYRPIEALMLETASAPAE
jgi:hypothetical protein